MKVQELVTDFIKKHHLLSENKTVLLGVSGGQDSMALLHYFKSIREDLNLNLIVLSADHRLRGEQGREDLEYVREVCDKWNVPFIGTALNIKEYKRKKRVGTQIAARKMRYQFFLEQMQEQEADYLALGHHADDQIETMLMEMVRTADSSSLSGIPVKRTFGDGLLIRPLLCVTKNEIESYCMINNIIPKIDPSNKETTYTRNYYRKYIVPLLKEKNNNLPTTIQHLSESLTDDEKFLRQEAKKMVDCIVFFHEKNHEVSLLRKDFKSYPTALQRRAYHLILNYLYDKLPKNLSYVHENYFFGLLNNDGNIEIDFPHHLKIKKSYEKITFYFAQSLSQDTTFHEVLSIPGTVYLPEGNLSAMYTNKLETQHPYSLFIPVDTPLPLHIRTRRAGDRMSWKGLNGSKKIKDVFIDEKIPIEERNTWPIVTDDEGTILWLVGLKKRQSVFNEKELFIKITYDKKQL